MATSPLTESPPLPGSDPVRLRQAVPAALAVVGTLPLPVAPSGLYGPAMRRGGHSESKRPCRTASERVADCGRRKVVLRCPDCGKFYTVLTRCRSRFCKPCARARSMKWFHRLREAVLSWRWPMMLTLTTIACPDVATSVDLALASFRKLRRAYRFKRWFYAVEVKRSEYGWYVHIHCLVDRGRWLAMPSLLAKWQGMTGAYIGDVKRVDRHRVAPAVLEVVKYLTKGVSDGTLTASEVDTLDVAVKGRRLVTASRSLALSLLDTEETSLHGLACPDCGSVLYFAAILPTEAMSDLPVYVYPVKTRAGPPAAADSLRTGAVTAAPLALVTLTA
jgi:hypothetical protein